LHPDLAGPAAICTTGDKTIRGWPATSSVESKAAPTNNKLVNLIQIGFFCISSLRLGVLVANPFDRWGKLSQRLTYPK
jgi:hypothetical protein